MFSFRRMLLADFVQMFFAHRAAELRIVQQQIGQFAALLNQVQLGHAFGLAFEFGGRNAEQLG